MAVCVIVGRDDIPLLFLGSSDVDPHTLELTSTLLLDRCELLRRRWVADDRRRGAARLQRYPRAASICRDQLLAGRICVRLRARVLGRPRRGRRLVWPCTRACDLRRAPAVAFHPARSGADICRRRRRNMLRHDHDGAPVDRAPRPSRRRHRDDARRTDLRALYAAGGNRRGRSRGRATPTAGSCCASRPRAPTASHRSVRILASAAAAPCSTGPGIAIAPGSATLWSAALDTRPDLTATVDDLIDAHGEGRRRAVFHARRGTPRHSLRRLRGRARAPHRADRPLPDSRVRLSTARWRRPGRSRRRSSRSNKPLDIAVTATDSGLDIDVRGSGPLTPAIGWRLHRSRNDHRLVRLTRHGELVARRAAADDPDRPRQCRVAAGHVPAGHRRRRG